MVGENELYGMYDMWHVPFWQTTAFLYGASALAASCVLFAGWFFYKKRSALQKSQTSWDTALAGLHDLQKHERITADQCKEFYFILTHILRNYLQERYHYALVGKTDEEVITYLTKANFPPEFLAMMETIFNGCVMVKFANMHAIQANIERDLLASIVLVKRTVPTEKK